MREFYVRLCQRENTDVTYMMNNGALEVTFEQAIYRGFKTLVLSILGDIVFCDGFNSSEIDYFQRFLAKNRPLIERMAKENASNI